MAFYILWRNYRELKQNMWLGPETSLAKYLVGFNNFINASAQKTVRQPICEQAIYFLLLVPFRDAYLVPKPSLQNDSKFQRNEIPCRAGTV